MSTLPDYDRALALGLAGIEPLPAIDTVALMDAAGRVLAESVVADRDLPPFNRAQMDGYALRSRDLAEQITLPVFATVPAGFCLRDAVPDGACVKIATGAPLPDQLDVVIQHERSDRADPVTLDGTGLTAGHAVHPAASDARAGDELIAAGIQLRGQHLGIAASAGHSSLRVTAQPTVTVLTSGDEVRPIDAALELHQIRNSNAPQTLELLRRFGAGTLSTRHVPDDLDATIDAVGHAIAASDLVVTVGGVSAGERDYFPTAFETHGVERQLHGAAIQPGKPIVIGSASRPDGRPVVIVALPGNPVSGLACACLFLWPIVRRLIGLPPVLPWRTVALAEPVRPNRNRRAFRPARLDATGDRATVPPWAGSGDLAHTALTDGMVQLPVQDEPVAAETLVRFLPWP